MTSDLVARGAADAAPEPDTEGTPVVAGGARRRTRRIAARVVLVIGCLFSALGLVLLVACFIDDRTIENNRGEAVAEVLDTSLTRTVVRFNDSEGRVHIPPGGVLYPSGLQEGQLVRVEYDTNNPELVRVAGRTVMVALLPVLSALAVVWALVVPVYWLLRRSGPPARRN